MDFGLVVSEKDDATVASLGRFWNKLIRGRNISPYFAISWNDSEMQSGSPCQNVFHYDQVGILEYMQIAEKIPLVEHA